jgi:uncharacterized protein YecT (DUF1311 family)
LTIDEPLERGTGFAPVRIMKNTYCLSLFILGLLNFTAAQAEPETKPATDTSLVAQAPATAPKLQLPAQLPEKRPSKLPDQPTPAVIQTSTSSEEAPSLKAQNDVCVEKADCEDILAENERTACIDRAGIQSDKNLKDLYKVIKQKMQKQFVEDSSKLKQDGRDPMLQDAVKADKQTRSRLILAENAWVQFRDANCYLVSAESIGGSGEGQQYTSCINMMTKKRVEELQNITERLFSR